MHVYAQDFNQETSNLGLFEIYKPKTYALVCQVKRSEMLVKLFNQSRICFCFGKSLRKRVLESTLGCNMVG